jgi:hypothetical protein
MGNTGIQKNTLIEEGDMKGICNFSEMTGQCPTRTLTPVAYPGGMHRILKDPKLLAGSRSDPEPK